MDHSTYVRVQEVVSFGPLQILSFTYLRVNSYRYGVEKLFSLRVFVHV